MRKLWQRGAIALVLMGIISGCNLTSPSPPSRLPQLGREKPRVQQPTPKPGTREPVSSVTNNRNLLLGNPSHAASSVASTDNYLMVKPQYVLSYNNKTHIANWVSWQLNRSWIGTADRKNDFRPDDALPATWYKVHPNDYAGSGYDRGHVAPSADRTRNEADNSATFLMSNMMPQVPELNRGVWGDLKEYCRELVQRRARNFTSPAGPVGRKSSIDSSRKSQCWQRLGKLSWCWIDRDWECRELTQTLLAIAVMMPNDSSVKGKGWKSFRVPVKQVERETGLNFLSNVPSQVQQVIESKVDSQ